MTCQECELALGEEWMTLEAEAHLANCAECRGLAAELRANSDAFRRMAEEAFPLVAFRKPARARWASIGIAAAAAILVIVLAAPRRARVELPSQAIMAPPAIAAAVIPPEVTPRKMVHKAGKLRTVSTLKVKMFTSDPNVVIYWLVDKKEGIE